MSARGNNSTASTVKALTLMFLLTGCASAPPSRAVPTLSDPPAGAIEALAAAGYRGHFALELETRDVTHDERPAAATKAAELISELTP